MNEVLGGNMEENILNCHEDSPNAKVRIGLKICFVFLK